MNYRTYPEVSKDFLEEIEAICRKYNISISHQDGQGAFEFDHFDEDYMQWFKWGNDIRFGRIK